MNYYLAIGLGGAVGAMSRYWLSTLVETFNGTRFPLGTFAVNLIGSILIGVSFVILTEKIHLAEQWRPLIMIGFLGAFTTFSAFSLEALLLMQQGHHRVALGYLITSVMACVLGAWSGMQFTRSLM
ncbi:MAG: fluoride efflux transporter CrcB [Pseudohongiellaceae bacterium]